MTEQDAASPEHPVVEVEAVARTTFAAAQNSVPVLRRIAITGSGERSYSNLRLTMTPQPAFCGAKEWTVDRVGAGETVEVGDRRVTLDFGVLDRLNEAEHGQLIFRLYDGETLLDERVVPIELLARDEWGGSGEMAQILAAFVSPNHPAVSAILKKASGLLERSGQSGALDGYQSRDPRRAHMLAEAIWSAIGAMGLSYAVPPRSFERQGQKVRDPGSIAATGLATCLDTTLLLAAAFEAAGLNPAVIFTAGHAFVGVWLVDKTFPMVVEPDVIAVRKAVDSREFVTLESTLLTHRGADFRRAKVNGASQLAEDAEKAFHMAVDVARARAAGIRPISGREAEVRAGAVAAEVAEPAAEIAMPPLEEMPTEFVEEFRASPADRLDRWQKKLLDLSLRNRLLNFSETRQTLGLVCADVPALEDALAAGKKFRIVSIKDENPVGNRDARLHREQTGQDIEREFAAAVFEKGQVCAVETGKEMQARLTTLYRAARSDLAEGGTNTLFMAVGFLRWKKNAGDERSYRAPLLLLPIKLSRRSAASAYDLSHHEDDVVFNQTLLEFLERDFGLAIPALRGELPQDQSGLDIQRIFGIVKQAVRDVPGFEVIEEIALSTFSFAKYLMWKDLVDRTDSLRNNRLVRHLLDNPTEPFRDGTGAFTEPGAIDERVDPAALYTPLPADSSQLAAVLGAEAGKDFVIIGPPGTGKSQTIANMIAHCLAHGKTVLFVAEKSAALDVVHRRLKAYGLADACLELHSNKADRKSVIAQLGAAWDRAERTPEHEWVRLTDAMKIQRHELNRYVAELHRPGSHGCSVYGAIGVLAGGKPKFELSFSGAEAHDREGFASLADLAERLALAHRAVAGCDSLEEIGKTEWSFGWERALLDAAARYREGAVGLLGACRRFEGLLGVEGDGEVAPPRLAALSRLADAVGAVASEDYRFAGREDLGAMVSSLDDLERAAEAYRRAKGSLSAGFEDGQILRMPVRDLDTEWRRESVRLWPLSALGKARVRKLLQSYARDGRVVPQSDLPALIEMRDALERVSGGPASGLRGFDGVRTDVASLRAMVRNAVELRAAAAGVAGPGAGTAAVMASMDPVLAEGGERSELGLAAAALREAKSRFDEAGRTFLATAEGVPAEVTLAGLIERLKGVERGAGRLNDWVKWAHVRREAEERGLGPMVGALRAGLISDARADFEAAYFGWWLPLAIDQCPTLRGFVHWEHEDRIAKFRSLIESVETLAAAQVRRALAHGLPARDGVPRKSELACCDISSNCSGRACRSAG